MPTLTQFEYILALQRERHFGRAAAACHVSQPTLSTQVQKLEAELGVVVFDRQSRPLEPTLPGRRVLELAREVVAANQRLLASVAAMGELAGPFTLGVIPTLAAYVLPWFLGPFAQRHPRVELTVVERPTEVIVRELHEGRMDAAILATPVGEAAFVEERLFYDPFYIYARSGDALLESEVVDLEALDSGQLWLLEDGHCFRVQVIHLCGLHERSLLGSVRFAGGSFETLRGLIDRNGGYTLVPETYAMTLPSGVRRAQVRPLLDRVPVREVGLIHHRNGWKVEMRQALLELLRERVPSALSAELAEGEVLPIID